MEMGGGVGEGGSEGGEECLSQGGGVQVRGQ